MRARGVGDLWGAGEALGSKMIDVRETASGVTFAVKVHPRANRNAVAGEVGGALKIALTAPPENGRANEACIEFLAKFLDVSRSSITIAAGQSSRSKVIRIAGLNARQIIERLVAKK